MILCSLLPPPPPPPPPPTHTHTHIHPSLALYGMCVQAKGQYHLLVGESSQAASELIEAVRVAEKVYGTNHLQV